MLFIIVFLGFFGSLNGDIFIDIRAVPELSKYMVKFCFSKHIDEHHSAQIHKTVNTNVTKI